LKQTKENENAQIKKHSVNDKSSSGIPKIPKSVYDALNTGQNPRRRPPKS